MVALSLISTVAFWISLITVPSHSAKGLWLAFIIFYGIAGGGYSALFTTMVAEVFRMQSYADVNGLMYFCEVLERRLADLSVENILGCGGSGLSAWKGVEWFDAALLASAVVCVVGFRVLYAVDRREWA